MEICRACLLNEKEMIPLDETFIFNYNLLTDLNITKSDGLPQYSCQNCVDVVKFFIDFREKSILSENQLRDDIVQNIKEEELELNPDILNDFEIFDKNKVNDTPLNVKQEFDNQSVITDGCNETLQEYDDNVEDMKYLIKKETKKSKLKAKPSKLQKRRIRTVKVDEKDVKPLLLLCGICKDSFAENSELHNHIDTHKNSSICQICFEKFNNWPSLLSHRVLHLPPKQKKCHVCTKKYVTPLYLEHHYRTIHHKGDTKLQCKLCSYSYTTPRKLMNHTRRTHANVKYMCDYCSRWFIDKGSLRIHIQSHSDIKAYVCDLCGFSCKYSTGLMSHKIRRHTIEKVTCNQCKRVFANPNKYDMHKCNLRTNVCPICGKEFNQSNKYSRHVNSHKKVGMYKCDICPVTYKTRGALNVHINKHNGIRTKQCEYCSAKFYSASVLIKHRRIHTGEKPYVCRICQKAFTGNHNLKVHMKVHGEYLVVKKCKDETTS